MYYTIFHGSKMTHFLRFYPKKVQTPVFGFIVQFVQPTELPVINERSDNKRDKKSDKKRGFNRNFKIFCCLVRPLDVVLKLFWNFDVLFSTNFVTITGLGDESPIPQFSIFAPPCCPNS